MLTSYWAQTVADAKLALILSGRRVETEVILILGGYGTDAELKPLTDPHAVVTRALRQYRANDETMLTPNVLVVELMLSKTGPTLSYLLMAS